jgi:hypothetical protein
MARAIVNSKYGRVLQAIRDAESRVMFTGYDPVAYKLSIWTLSAVMCGVAGALYVPQVGIINPGEMSPAASIEIAIWAAVGGRATLIGPIVGAFFVNGAKSWFTQAFPEFWLFFLGALVHRRHAVPAERVGRPVEAQEGPGMTPDLFEDGAERLAAWQQKKAAQGASSGDRGAAYGRVATIGEPDFAHGVALYLDEISVSFDGFKA